MGFRGIPADNDARYTNAEKKLLQSTKFPAIYSTKIDTSKVNAQIMSTWVSKRVTELLGFEDEVVIELVNSMLEERFPDPRKCQITLTGFLEKKTESFMVELWDLLISAQESIGGIPAKLLQAKKDEIQKRRAEETQIEGGINSRLTRHALPDYHEPRQSRDDFERPSRMRQPGLVDRDGRRGIGHRPLPAEQQEFVPREYNQEIRRRRDSPNSERNRNSTSHEIRQTRSPRLTKPSETKRVEAENTLTETPERGRTTTPTRTARSHSRSSNARSQRRRSSRDRSRHRHSHRSRHDSHSRRHRSHRDSSRHRSSRSHKSSHHRSSRRSPSRSRSRSRSESRRRSSRSGSRHRRGGRSHRTRRRRSRRRSRSRSQSSSSQRHKEYDEDSMSPPGTAKSRENFTITNKDSENQSSV